MNELKIASPIPPGSVLSLPGSVIHAGPAASDYRSVLFFSACPIQDDNVEYNPDTQYTGIFLCGWLVILLWRLPGMGVVEREYLLEILLHYMQESSVKRHFANHFPVGAFAHSCSKSKVKRCR